jgi:hypothetical protein
MRIKPGFSALSCFGLAAAALLNTHLVQAQAAGPLLARPAVRISQPVSNSALVMLKHNTSPMAQAQFDRGVAPSSTETGRIQLLLRPSAAQSEALREYLGDLQNPNSQNYHKWLTPQTYGASFGISDADLEKVEAWLQSEGFTVNSVPASRNMITFSGTFGQVTQAFHTSIHSYLINGVKHYSNASDPSIPAALAPVVLGVSPLNDFHPTPMHTRPIQHTVMAQGGHLKVVSESVGSVKPQLTATDSNGDNILLLAPGDAATIYDSPNTLNSAYTGSTPQTGSGVNIGLVGDSDLPLADYLNYRKLFLNETSPVPPTRVIDGVDPGQVDDGSSAEALIDTELSAALAPKASIYFYSSADDLFQHGALDAALRAVEDNNVAILSVSFGECEYDLGPSGNEEIDSIWQQAAAQGITVLVSTGDSGSASCDVDNLGEASGGLAVSGFASTPYNIAVGGTDFDVLNSAFDTYVGTSNATAGSSSNYFDSALKYIPENPWNDSISNNPPGSYTTNTVEQYSDSSTGKSSPLVTGGGGGASSAAVCEDNDIDENGNCDSVLAGYPTPSFQTGVSIAGQNPDGTPTGVRYLPDVSLFASAGNLHDASWAICADNVVNGDTTASTDCEPDSTGEFGISAYGGTSTASPAFAGILAMVVQSIGSGKRLGLANNVLYNLNTTDSSAGIFHDITAGNISQPCESGSPDCGTNGFLEGWNAGTGYDLASGLGSVDIGKLVSGWDAALFTPTTVTLTANGSVSTLSVVHGTSVTLASTLSPKTATGTVSVVGPTSAAGAAVNEVIPITSGTGSTAVTDLPGGVYAIHAYYQGDVKDAPSTSSPAINVNITPEASTPFLSVNEYDLATGDQPPNPTTAPYGEYGYVYVQPANTSLADTGVSNGFATGTVTLNTGSGTVIQTLNSEGVAAFPLYAVSPGNYSFSAQYSGDSSYKASSTTTSVPFTISKATTALNVTSSSSTIAASGMTTVTVVLETDSAGNPPGGSITLKAGNGASFTGVATDASLSDGADAVIDTFTVSGASLASGSNTLTATYPGDTNYGGSSGTVKITVSGTSGGGGTTPGFNINSQSPSLSITAGQSSGPDTITVSPTNGFTGAVALNCKVQVNLAAGTLPTCSLSTSSVTISGTTAQTVTLTVNTTALSALQPMHRPEDHMLRRLLAGGSGLAFCSVLLFGIPGRRRSWQSMLVVLLVFGMLGAIGCGSTSTGSNGTQPGTYTVTVTGSGGGTTANTVIAVSVQ